MTRSRPTVRDIGATLVAGMIAGGILLGLGGRLAMRAIAIQNGSPRLLTPSGTLTVILAGIASGLAGAVLYLIARAVARRVAPRHPWVRRALFGILLTLITLRGLRPVQPLSLALFGPLVLLYAAVIEIIALRRGATTRDARPPTDIAVRPSSPPPS